ARDWTVRRARRAVPPRRARRHRRPARADRRDSRERPERDSPAPVKPRRFSARRPIRLSDTDATGRLRLDAVARYLQDTAADDILDAGWAPDEHIWVVRRTTLKVERPFVGDAWVELDTWCAGIAAAAAARRTTIAGDHGGRAEAEMTWIHLGR